MNDLDAMYQEIILDHYKHPQNAGLREQIRRLKSDPATIEAVARQELGLIRPTEVLFLVKP